MNDETYSLRRLTGTGFVLVLFALCLTILALKSRPAPLSYAQQQPYKVIPVQAEASALQEVELACEPARLLTPNGVEKISCTLTNRSLVAITAGTLAVTVNLQRDGQIQSLTVYDSFDTFLHPDFREEHPNNVIAPGQSYRLEGAPTSFDGLVMDVSASVDYVELANGRTSGSDKSGSRIIRNLRQGARKYKAWLVKNFNEKGRSVEAVLSLLSETQSLPELSFADSDEAHGARLYRIHARRTYEAKGGEVLARQLRRLRLRLPVR